MPAQIEAILAAARAHTNEVIKPNVGAWNEAGVWPRDASDKASAVGLTGLYAPEEFGGQGLPLGEGIRVYEELGKGDGAYAFALSMHNICTYACCGFGTDAFKEKWSRELTSGRKLANFSLTEPQSGSDASNMYSRAAINGDGTWTINGAKAWGISGRRGRHLFHRGQDHRQGRPPRHGHDRHSGGCRRTFLRTALRHSVL